jgi:hypothetical protein
MGTLKESIQHKVCLFKPKSLEHAYVVTRKFESKNIDTRRLVTKNYRDHHAPSKLIQTTRLTPQKMDERREKGLCFN